MNRRIVFLMLLTFIGCGAMAQNDAMYIYRNDGVINAFLKAEIDSVRHSPLDLDSVMHAENVTQEVWMIDTVYRIPLAAIDSISFVTPPTVYKNDVTKLEYNLLDYIIGADGLVLKLKLNTPAMIIPVKGAKLVLLEGTKVLPYGFSGIVSDVQYGSSSIDVVCEQAYLEDLFDSFSSVSTVYGYNPDSIGSNPNSAPGGPHRVAYAPDDIVFSLGPYRINRTYEVSQGIKYDGDLALSGGTNFSVEVQPTFRIHTFLILGEGHGTYFNCSITGDLQVTSQSSLYGSISYNHDFDGIVASFPIPATANMVNFYINPGLFVRANASISSSVTSSQRYTFGMYFDYSSKGQNSFKPSIGGRLAGSSVDMSGCIDGSIGAGVYIETGFNLLSREIAKVCVRGELGAQFSSGFVFRNSDIEGASKETKLYERLKTTTFELSSFANVSLQASVAHTGNGLTWEDSEPIFTRNLVPEFSNTKLSLSAESTTSLDAYTELRGNCILPVPVGYKLFDKEQNEVADYDAGVNYTNKAAKLEHTFTGLQEDERYDYVVYPKVKLFGFDVLASPAANVESCCPDGNHQSCCPDGNHPHAIDLGLPSGTKWSCCNVGASRPEDYGDYFAWGETKPKTTYDDWSTYKYCKGENYTLTKYCVHSWWGTVDNKTELEPSDDAATANWGNNWQMPSLEQCEELINSSYTTTTWTTLNGVYGRKITSKSNGNSIFLPAAGYRNDASLNFAGSHGYYWSRSLSTSNSSGAYCLRFNPSIISTNHYVRYYGQSVRPVRVR